MKTDAALSWKGFSLSAVLHGTVFAAAGVVLMKPAQVGTQEAPVTAEFQIFSEAASSCAVPPKKDAKQNRESCATGSLEELAPEESPVENALPLPVRNEKPPACPGPLGNQPASSAPSPSRTAHGSMSHPIAAAYHGARNILPDYLENPPPQYPESARLAGEQGIVLVRAGVASSGEVSRVVLAHSSGHPSLDRVALEAVARWKFRPATAAGIAMASEVTVPVRFELHEAKTVTVSNP